jgi:hypothetical protein
VLWEPDRRRRDEERPSRSEQRTLSKPKHYLTGKAPYKFESISLQRGVNCEPVRAGGIALGIAHDDQVGAAGPHVQLGNGRGVGRRREPLFQNLGLGPCPKQLFARGVDEPRQDKLAVAGGGVDAQGVLLWGVACTVGAARKLPSGGDTELDLSATACFILGDWSASWSCGISPSPKDDLPGHTILVDEPAAMQRLSAIEAQGGIPS